MSLCVNTASREFKDTAKRLDISEASLENIVHNYINTEGNENSFPSDSYILSQVEGVPFPNLSNEQLELINKKYSEPITVDTYEEAMNVVSDMIQYFDPSHIGLKNTYNGKYQVSINNRKDTELSDIKKKSIANGTFMKAPNGKPTNLTEKQWLQVRTKAFKEWFGDWETVARQKFGLWGAFNQTSATYEGVSVTRQQFNPDMAPDGGSRDILIQNGNEYEVIGDIPTIETSDAIYMSGSIGAATEVYKNYRGKGFGKKAHIALAIIAAKDGKTLYSDSSNSDVEDALWKSLVKDGLAEVIEEKPKTGNWNHTTYRIKNSALPKGEVHGFDDNVSKVVDENGEPLVVYHNARKKYSDFSEKLSKNGRVYFSSFKNKWNQRGNEETQAFLNIRNPKEDNIEINSWYNPKSNEDGLILENNDVVEEYIVFNASQIKSATDNSGAFSTENNNIRANLESSGIENLLDYISREGRDKFGELISKYNGRYYRTIKTPEDEIERLRETSLLPKGIFKYPKEGTGREIILDNSVLNDYIERNNKSVNFSNLFESTQEAEQVRRVLDFLSAKTGLKYTTITERGASKLLNKHINKIKNVNAFVVGDTAYFIEGRRLNTDIAAEEMLHPFVASIKIDNSEAFDSLVRDAAKAFPKLRLEILKSYSRGTVNEELVTQALSRAFRQEFEEHPNHRAIADLINKFINYIKGWFRNTGDMIVSSINDKIYATDLSESITISNLAQIINTEIGLGSANNVERVSLNQEAQQVRDELKVFQDKIDRVINGVQNLRESGYFSETDIRESANDLADYMSDFITDVINNPAVLNQIGFFPELFSQFTTDEELQAEYDKIKNMTRLEVVKYLTPSKFVNKVRDILFNNNSELSDVEATLKASLAYDNFETLLWWGKDRFEENEEFSINISEDTVTANDDLNPINDDLDGSTENDEIVEELGNQQEHYQIEQRTRSVLDRMGQVAKQGIRSCLQKQIDPSTGEITNVRNWFGSAKRVNLREASQSLDYWLSGAQSMEMMIKMLEDRKADNPWLEQLITKLKDNTGNETTFQAQFFGIFSGKFQPYSVVTKEKKDGVWVYNSKIVNENPALKSIVDEIKTLQKVGLHPLFTNNGTNAQSLETLQAIRNDLKEFTNKEMSDANKVKVVDLLQKALVSLGANIDQVSIYTAIKDSSTFDTLVNNLDNIVRNLENAKDVKEYDPFKFKGDNNIAGYLTNFLAPLTEKMEETAISTVYDSGKMYQSRVTPSYLTNLISKFSVLEGEEFNRFLEEEYGQYTQFADKNPDGTISRWKNPILNKLSKMQASDRKRLFKHRVQLNFNKHNYMKNMTTGEYGLSILTEFCANLNSKSGYEFTANFRMPMMSNKPSSEFVGFYAYRGAMGREILLNNFYDIFNYELGRIQTVLTRDFKKGEDGFIKNFDKNGKKFMFLNFLEKSRNNKDSELGKLINKAIEEGTSFDSNTGKGLTTDELSRMKQLVREEIGNYLDNKANNIVQEWKENGIFESAKQIANIGKSDAEVEEMIKTFVWNDSAFAMNILQLTVTDIAFYKDAEDLQKRLAQLHAPGIRPYVEATDFNGNRISDGKFRTVLLKDIDNFKSNIIDNLRVIFNRRLATIDKNSSAYNVQKVFYDNIIKQYQEINFADAQGYSSISSYRKKALLFGKWSREAENIYNRILSNNYTFNDLKTAFQPLKPFVYGQIGRNSIPGISNSAEIVPYGKLKIPVQFKNSEYLILMADALMMNEDTGKPNILKAISNVMEQSFRRDNTRGIDTFQFESTCKSGLQATVDLSGVFNMDISSQAEADYVNKMIEKKLNNSIYDQNGNYKVDTYVYEVPFENYAIQQEVPGHFKNHYQAHGSQTRYIIASDLETTDLRGNPVTYDFYDNGVLRRLSRDEFKTEYENTVAANIEESIQELANQLGLGNDFISYKDRNIALSKILIEEISSSPRYGSDLAVACTIDPVTGNFRIPLGDPIQSKRIEQLINSIVKNRINKQEIAGGPVVQVSNFGTSRELNIVYNKRGGGLLLTKSQWIAQGNEESDYQAYVDKNQAGIAYHEAYVSIYSNDLFNKFADRDGVINIEDIEKVDPELLKLIGYRIPTEDKYSITPIKIVGFLPREAGDGIMLPADITLINGSDFDIDKMYLMRKEVDISERVSNKKDFTNVLRNTSSFRETAKKLVTEEDKNEYKNRQSTKDRLKRLEDIHNSRLDTIDKFYDSEEELNKSRLEKEIANIEIGEKNSKAYKDKVESIENKYDKIGEREHTRYEKNVERENKRYEKKLAQFEEELVDEIINAKISQVVDMFFNIGESNRNKPGDKLYNQIKDLYLEYKYHTVYATTGRTYRNNKIFDMHWAVLTNETTAEKMLNPGGFVPEKALGYMVAAFKNPANNYSWADLKALANGQKGLLNGKIVSLDPNNSDIETGVDAVKTLCYTEKNLCFIDTHLNFYRQNSAAATALGMAAVQKVAHAALEGDKFAVDVRDAVGYENDESGWSIAGKRFGGLMEVDGKYDDEGKLIGRTLGEFVAMFADAVKDPVANLMNINNSTMPIITTLIRLGLPFEKAGLFVAQPVIEKAIAVYNNNNLSGKYTTLAKVFEDIVSTFEKDNGLNSESSLYYKIDVTEEELIDNLSGEKESEITGPYSSTDYVVAKIFTLLSDLVQPIKAMTYLTRFNSISNAVGPQIVDNIILENKVTNEDLAFIKNLNESREISATIKSILDKHPILEGFYRTIDVAKHIFSEMPVNSDFFRSIVLSTSAEDIRRAFMNDRKLLSQFGDFFQSYLLVASDVIKVDDKEKFSGLKYYIEQFPRDFMRGKAKERFRGNALIDAIKFDIQKGRLVLKVDISGLDQGVKNRYSDAWADLYNSGESGQKLAMHLFNYNFFRTGIGFSPKSFMNLLPISMRDKIKGYNKAYEVHSDEFGNNVSPEILLDQFIRNNADNNKLVPWVDIPKGETLKNATVKLSDSDTNTYEMSHDKYDVKNKTYIKVKVGNETKLLKKINSNKKESFFKEISMLGNNGEYFEVSLSNITKALNNTTEVTEQNKDTDRQEITNNESNAETIETSVERSDEQVQKRVQEIYDLVDTAFRTYGLSDEQIKVQREQIKGYSEEKKQSVKDNVKKFFVDNLSKKNIKVDDKTVEEMYKSLC